MSGPVYNSIQSKVIPAYSPEHIELLNESHNHSVPKNSETHFKLFIVSKQFQGQSRVVRQRGVYQLLAEELAGPVHALSLRLLTPEEWKQTGESQMPKSPDCQGGSKVR